MSERKIYVVVPKTVQTPLRSRQTLSKTRWISVPGEETKTIVQPVGRIAAQVAHVVSKMRAMKVRQYAYAPITTIILSVPDSFYLEFIQFLLEEKRLCVYTFRDENEEYGVGQTIEPITTTVLTAICTEPVSPEAVEGVLDYLPLWDGK